MNTLPPRIDDPRVLNPNPLWNMESMVQISPDDDSFSRVEGNDKSYRLKSYVTYLDADALQRYAATIRTKGAVSLIEKQTQALFGRPDVKITEDGLIDTSNDNVVNTRLSGLTMLVLEAVAFGLFLWEAESYVGSNGRRYIAPRGHSSCFHCHTHWSELSILYLQCCLRTRSPKHHVSSQKSTFDVCM